MPLRPPSKGMIAPFMATPSPRSRLWIDESGKFENRGDMVVVAGLLDNGPIADYVIRRVLKEQSPGFPWPLHAAHYRHTVALVLANVTVRTLDPTRANPWLDDASTSAVAVLQRGAPVLTKSALDEMEAGRLPHYEAMARLENLLRASVGQSPYTVVHHARLEAARDLLVAAVRSGVQSIAALKLGVGIVATEKETGTGGTSTVARLKIPHLQPSATDRYVALLAGAFRAARRQARGDRPAGAQITATVLARPMHAMRGTTSEDVDRVVRQSGCAETFAPSEVKSYSVGTHGCHVLADFIANAARQGLVKARHRNIPPLASIATEVGIPIDVEWVGP